MRGVPGCSGYAPDSGSPQVAVQAGGLQRELWGRRRAEDAVLCPGSRGGRGRGGPAGRPVPRAASPEAAGGLWPGALPTQVSSPRTSSRWLELRCVPMPGQVPWGWEGGSAAQGTPGNGAAGQVVLGIGAVGSHGAAGVKPGGLRGRGGRTERSLGCSRPGCSAAEADA